MRRLIILLAVLLSGCGDPAFVGRFKTAALGEVIEFTKNGGVVIQTPTMGAVSGRWQSLEGGRVSISLDGLLGLAGASICSYTSQGNDVVLANCPMAMRLTRL